MKQFLNNKKMNKIVYFNYQKLQKFGIKLDNKIKRLQISILLFLFLN